MGTPPRVSRRRSILNQRRLNASVSQTITEEENAVDLLFCIDGASHENQVSSHSLVCMINCFTVNSSPQSSKLYLAALLL